MKEFELFEALSDIDERYILQAHERPAPRTLSLGSKLRRVAVAAAALAACAMLMVPALAGGWEFSTDSLLFFYGDSDNCGYTWRDRQGFREVDNNSFFLNDSDIQYTAVSVFNTESLQYHVVCENRAVKVHHGIGAGSGRMAVLMDVPMKISLEAMVLMEDGRVLYKQTEAEGYEEMILTLDNVVDGETGIIINIRRRIQFKTPSGWVEADNRSCYLPGQMGFSVPYGTDPRFPDMQYNYDGRGTAAGQEEEEKR